MLDLPLQLESNRQAGGVHPVGKSAYHLDVVDTHHPLRGNAQAFIAEGFERCYGACIYHYMPYLITLASDEIKACLGVRPATESLFIEHYLDRPIEQSAPDLAIPREQIVEIGNLVSLSRHATIKLFMNASVALYQAGYQQLVFCATRTVARIIRQTGADLKAIVEADGRRLGDSLAEWGRYYDTEPVVMHLNLESVFELIQNSPLLYRQTVGHEVEIANLVAHLAMTGTE